MKPNSIKIIQYLFLILAFLAGIYVCLTNGILLNKEGFNTEERAEGETSHCPDLLIKRNNRLFLYDTTKPIVENVNPIKFGNLDEYIAYLNQQRTRGVNCPVLFLQQENNAQGNDVYRMRPSPFYVEGGLPTIPMEIHDNTIAVPIADASRMDPPYNANSYAGFDPAGQYVGIYTDIDEIHNSTKKGGISDNPMDPNWGGVGVTQRAIEEGKYEGSEVSKPIYPTVIHH